MKKQGLFAAVALTLAALLGIGYIGTSVALKSWNPKNWVKEQQEQEEQEDNTANNLVIAQDYASADIQLMSEVIPMSAYEEEGIATYADSAYTLTATVTPDTATYKAVTWAIAWKDASSTWANGKTVTDYVTITPTAEGALTANLACSKAFGEQVIVTVACQDDTSKTATATVDYRKRLEGVTTKLTNTSGAGGTLSTSTSTSLKLYDSSATSTNYTLGVTLQESVGSIDSEYSYNFYILGTSQLQTRMSNIDTGSGTKGYVYGSKPTVITSVSSSSSFATNTRATEAFNKSFFFSWVVYIDRDNDFEDDSAGYTKAQNAIISYLSKYSSEVLLAPTLVLTYNGVKTTYTYKATLDISPVKVSVSSVSLDQLSFVF
jgi:hypothetical protein